MADELTRIALWSCICDRKCVAKEKYLKNQKTIKNHFRIKEPCSFLDPVIELAATNAVPHGSAQAGIGELAKLNYLYIERFQRYYFIDDIIFNNDGLIELHCSIDVLMSYANDIYGSQQEVIRAEKLNSPKYIDNERPILSDKVLTTKILGEFPASSGNNYVMTVAGG